MFQSLQMPPAVCFRYAQFVPGYSSSFSVTPVHQTTKAPHPMKGWGFSYSPNEIKDVGRRTVQLQLPLRLLSLAQCDC